MNYQEIYNSIVTRAKNRNLVGYSEKHHVIPRCLGGTNDKSNIVSLTGKEHYLVHLLLIYIYPEEKKLIYAFWMMRNRIKTNITSVKMYEEARKFVATEMRKNVGTTEAITKMAKSKLGKTPWLNKTHTNESRKKQSESAKTRKITNENEALRRASISKTSQKPKTAEHVENIRKAKIGANNPMFGKKWKLVDGKRIYYES